MKRNFATMLSMKPFSINLYAIVWMLQRILTVATQTVAPVAIEQSNILWSLSPCQSAFWVPSIPSEFNQNWITYQYEGNPLSQAGECVFTLESDPNTKIEMTVTQVQLFGNALTQPPPCLQLYDVKVDGSIVLLKQECNVFLGLNQFESFPTFTETNLAVISTTIRYGSFQLRARAVPKNFGFPNKVSPTTVNNIAIDTNPTVAPVIMPTTTKAPTGITRPPFPPVSLRPSINPGFLGPSVNTGPAGPSVNPSLGPSVNPTLGPSVLPSSVGPSVLPSSVGPPAFSTTKPTQRPNTSTMPIEIITPMPVNSSVNILPQRFSSG